MAGAVSAAGAVAPPAVAGGVGIGPFGGSDIFFGLLLLRAWLERTRGELDGINARDTVSTILSKFRESQLDRQNVVFLGCLKRGHPASFAGYS